jgi:hypothetical protein
VTGGGRGEQGTETVKPGGEEAQTEKERLHKAGRQQGPNNQQLRTGPSNGSGCDERRRAVPVIPPEEGAPKLAASRRCMLRDAPTGRPSACGKALIALRKWPHPEEVAKRPSRRTHRHFRSALSPQSPATSAMAGDCWDAGSRASSMTSSTRSAHTKRRLLRAPSGMSS